MWCPAKDHGKWNWRLYPHVIPSTQSMILLGERARGGYVTHPSLVTAVCTAFYLAVIKAVIHYITCVFFF